MKSGILSEFERRGLIHQITHDELDAHLSEPGKTLYCGFDPTADSLHVGSLLQICNIARFRRHGHRPLVIVGGATGMIGDPSGKSEERNLLNEETIQKNVNGIANQMRTILDRAMEVHSETLSEAADNEPIPVLNNFDWVGPWTYIEFLRDVGKNFRVNAMLQKDSVKSRLGEREQGMSYTEFSYMLLQAYDFLHLFETYDCALQIGGSDQWGNITAGTDLIRRQTGKPAFGLTIPLMLTASGTKFGKTEKGAVWLDKERTSPYEFYQYWIGREDSEVEALLRKFTFLSDDEIDEIVAEENRGQHQKKLAYEVTVLVHGTEEADKVVRASQMLFGEPIDGLSDRDLASIFADVPSTEVEKDRIQGGIGLLDLMTEVGIQKSKGAARRLTEQGGAYINNQRVEDVARVVSLDDLASESMLVLRAGKRNYHVVRVV